MGAASDLDALTGDLAPSKFVLLEDEALADATVSLVAESAFAVLARAEKPPRGLAALVRSAARAGSSPGVGGSGALPPDFVASSTLTRAVVRDVLTSIATPFPVLLIGEQGVGRHTLARAVLGPSFVSVRSNASLSSLERTLVDAPRAVLAEDIDELGADVQAAFAAWLGGPVGARAKVVAIVGPQLRDKRASGAFRRELAFAFARHTIDVPSLRERPDDIPVMTALFAKQLCDQLGLPSKRFSPNVLRALRAEPWPGNVPELAAAVDAAVMLAEARDRIVRADFACLRAPDTPTSDGPLRELAELPQWPSLKGDVLASVTRAYIDELMVRARGNQSLAARMAGLDPANFRRLERTLPTHLADPTSLRAIFEHVLHAPGRPRKS